MEDVKQSRPSRRAPAGRVPDLRSPHCLLPHWNSQTFWDFPQENTDAPFILSFSLITPVHSFTHETTSAFWSCAPKAFPVQWERQSLNQNPFPQGARLSWRASRVCGRPKELGGPCRWVTGRGRGRASQGILELSLREGPECVS